MTPGNACMQRRISLLYVIPGFGTGGTERLVVDLVTHLDPHRFAASVCIQQNGLFGQELMRRGYPVHVLAALPNGLRSSALGKFRSLCHRVTGLRALLESEQIDLVHTHHLGPLLHTFLGGMGSRRWRWVHTEHNIPDVNIQYPRWLVRLGRGMFGSANALTGVSDAVGAYFRDRKGAKPERVRVIHNGVDVDRFAGPYDGAAKRRELGIPPEAWVIGLVANLRPEKNHALLFRAFARLLADAPEARLILAGDGEMRGQLEAMADTHKIREQVHFLGSRLDAPELFATFDVFCLPSRYEGMPLTVFEAMAAGVPVVATRVVGIQEVVRDGETGLLVPPNDPDALASALLQARRNPRLCQELSVAGRHYVNTHARLKDMVEGYSALYEQIMTGVS